MGASEHLHHCAHSTSMHEATRASSGATCHLLFKHRFCELPSSLLRSGHNKAQLLACDQPFLSVGQTA